jgi:hypothetical protein
MGAIGKMGVLLVLEEFRFMTNQAKREQGIRLTEMSPYGRGVKGDPLCPVSPQLHAEAQSDLVAIFE